MSIAGDLAERFRVRFGADSAVYCAPGRINLLGEHTDYNSGFVLPAAIGLYCWVAIRSRADRKLVFYSENFRETIEADLDALPDRGSGKWADYPLGVARALERSGKRLSGADLYIRGQVPVGAGLSSSAALEISTGYALLSAARLSVDLAELARLSQRAENEFVGARCGIMDQFISCFGRNGHALLLDCRSLQFEMLRVPHGVHLAVCNTMVRHEHGSGEYNTRRAECEEAVRRLRQVLPQIRALRDVTREQLQFHRTLLGKNLYRRCLHVVTENDRSRQAASALRAGNLEGLGALFAESHQSLRDDYQVSCPELDLMVELAVKQRGVYGARMTGGGFGGCTINLVNVAYADEFRRVMADAYGSRTGLLPDIYICEAAHGVQAAPIDSRERGVSS